MMKPFRILLVMALVLAVSTSAIAKVPEVAGCTFSRGITTCVWTWEAQTNSGTESKTETLPGACDGQTIERTYERTWVEITTYVRTLTHHGQVHSRGKLLSDGTVSSARIEYTSDWYQVGDDVVSGTCDKPQKDSGLDKDNGAGNDWKLDPESEGPGKGNKKP